MQVPGLEPFGDIGVAVHADVSAGEFQEGVEDGAVRIVTIHASPIGDGCVDELLVLRAVVTAQTEHFRGLQEEVGVLGAVGRVAFNTAILIVQGTVKGILGEIDYLTVTFATEINDPPSKLHPVPEPVIHMTGQTFFPLERLVLDLAGEATLEFRMAFETVLGFIGQRGFQGERILGQSC